MREALLDLRKKIEARRVGVSERRNDIEESWDAALCEVLVMLDAAIETADELRFVRTTTDPDYPTALRALGFDGMYLYIVDRVGDEFLFGTLDPLRGDLVEWDIGKFTTESDAIAAAQAHDRRRRGGK